VGCLQPLRMLLDWAGVRWRNDEAMSKTLNA
jgi:hypothetical protein